MQPINITEKMWLTSLYNNIDRTTYTYRDPEYKTVVLRQKLFISLILRGLGALDLQIK